MMSLPMKCSCSVSRASRNSLEAARFAAGFRPAGREVVLERRQIADGRVQPDVEEFAGRVRDWNPEVRRVARDVPIAERILAGSSEPFAGLVDHLRLEPSGCIEPGAEKFDALGIRQPEEIVVGGLHQRLCAGQRRVWVDQIGGRVDDAADLACVGILVFRVAVRAFALDVAVRQEHGLHRVVELLDRLDVDESRGLQPEVDVLGKRRVLRRVRGIPVIEPDMKAIEISRPVRRDACDQRLGRDALGLGLEHDRRAVRVVGADEMHGVAAHPLEADPDVGLDVLHDVPDVQRAVRIGQGRGDEECARHRRSLPR